MYFIYIYYIFSENSISILIFLVKDYIGVYGLGVDYLNYIWELIMI